MKKKEFISIILFLLTGSFIICDSLEKEPVVLDADEAVINEITYDSEVHKAEAPALDNENLSKKETEDAEVIDIDLREDADEPGMLKQKERPYRGWKIKENSENEKTNVIEIATFDGRIASINIDDNLNLEKILKPIGRALDAAWEIPGMKADRAAVYVEDLSRFRLVVFPTSFVYKDINLCEYLPSGIAFSYDASLVYDVLLKVGDLMPRVTGIFISEKDLAELLYHAVIAPDVYVYDDSLAARVERLEKALLALAPKAMYSKPYEIDPELIQTVKKLYSENNDISKKEVIAWLKQRKIKYTQSDIDTIFVVLLGIYR